VAHVSILSTFPFLGEDYDDMSVASNGYVSFGSSENASLDAIVSSPDEHFDANKSTSFSLMLADLKPPAESADWVFVANVYAQLNESAAVPFATVVTFDKALVAFDTSEAKSTVQAFFEYETGAVTVTFGELSKNLLGMVGPSDGTVEPVHDLKDLISGTLSNSSACTSAGAGDDKQPSEEKRDATDGVAEDALERAAD